MSFPRTKNSCMIYFQIFHSICCVLCTTALSRASFSVDCVDETYRTICISLNMGERICFYLDQPINYLCDTWTRFKYPTWISSQTAQQEPNSRPENGFRHSIKLKLLSQPCFTVQKGKEKKKSVDVGTRCTVALLPFTAQDFSAPFSLRCALGEQGSVQALIWRKAKAISEGAGDAGWAAVDGSPLEVAPSLCPGHTSGPRAVRILRTRGTRPGYSPSPPPASSPPFFFNSRAFERGPVGLHHEKRKTPSLFFSSNWKKKKKNTEVGGCKSNIRQRFSKPYKPEMQELEKRGRGKGRGEAWKYPRN